MNDAAGPLGLVVGATGFTGREVVRELIARGARAVAHVRPDSARLDEWRERFAAMGAEVDATPFRETALAETMRRLRPAMVFCLLGTTRARMKKAHESDGESVLNYDAVDYGLTAQVVRAAALSGTAPKIIYLSAAGVRRGHPAAYYQARWRMEEELKGSGLAYVIARPSFITGPGRDDPRPGERYGSAVVDALLGAAGALGMKRLRDRYRSTTNVVLARNLVRLALDPAATAAVAESEGLRE